MTRRPTLVALARVNAPTVIAASVLGCIVTLALVVSDRIDETDVHALAPPPTFPVAIEPVDNVPTMAPGIEPEPVRKMRGTWPWDALAACESGGNWSDDSYHDGGLQFHPDTWRRHGGTEFAPYAWQATREQQIVVARRVLATEGAGAWPTCGPKVGLR